MIDPIEISVDGVTFACYLGTNKITFVRNGSSLSIYDSEIKIGKCIGFPASPLHIIELEKHLMLYQKALKKLNVLKTFI